MDFFERYLGIGVRGDGSLEVLFLVVLGMIVLVTMSYFFAKKLKEVSASGFRWILSKVIHSKFCSL